MNDLEQTLCIVKKQKAEGLFGREILGGLQLYPINQEVQTNGLRIHAVAPGGTPSDTFEKCLNRFENGLKKDTCHAKFDANEVSIALLVEYGESRVVLGGDVEKEGWITALKTFPASRLSSDIVKVSHHGSPNGYSDSLWSHFRSTRQDTIAVIAPSISHDLPHDDAIEHIKTAGATVYCASRPKGQRMNRLHSKTAIGTGFAPSWGIVHLLIDHERRVKVTTFGDACKL